MNPARRFGALEMLLRRLPLLQPLLHGSAAVRPVPPREAAEEEREGRLRRGTSRGEDQRGKVGWRSLGGALPNE